MKLFLEILKIMSWPFAILAKIFICVFRFLSKAYKNKQKVSVDIKPHEEDKIIPNYLDLLFATKEANQDYDEINYLLYDKTQKKYCLVTHFYKTTLIKLTQGDILLIDKLLKEP